MPLTPRYPRVLRGVLSEPAIYGVVLVGGLVVIIGNSADASWDVLVKVLATLLVFFLSHVYAFVVAHLGDTRSEDGASVRTRVEAGIRAGTSHSWGMLLAGAIPLSVLTLGVV